MLPISRPAVTERQPASDIVSSGAAASLPVSTPVSTRAASPRSQPHARLSELAGVDRLQPLPIAPTTFTAAAARSVAVQTFEEILTEWEWGAPKECLPHERKSRREAAHRIRCLREDAGDSLDLDDLYMTSLPPCLVELHSLRRLNVGGNNLQTVPDLPAGLTHLYVHGNRLTQLPDLPATLEVLDAHLNRLTRLPVLPAALKQLVIHSNPITHLPHVPATLELLMVHASVIRTSLRALEEKITALQAELQRLTQPLAPVTSHEAAAPALAASLPSEGSANGLERLDTQLIGTVAAYLAQASADVASFSVSGKGLHAVVQPGIDIARNVKDMGMAQEQIATLNRLARGSAS